MSSLKRSLSSPGANLKDPKMTKSSLEDLDKKLDLIFEKLSGENSGIKADIDIQGSIDDLKIELSRK
jgi:hypothetical protein